MTATYPDEASIAPLNCITCGKPLPAPLTPARLRERLLELAMRLAPQLPPPDADAKTVRDISRHADEIAGAVARMDIGWLLEDVEGICYDCSPTNARLKKESDDWNAREAERAQAAAGPKAR